MIFPLVMYVCFLIITLLSGKTGYFSKNAFSYIFSQSVLSTIIALAIAVPLSGGRWDFATGTIVVLGGIIGCNLAIQWNTGVLGLVDDASKVKALYRFTDIYNQHYWTENIPQIRNVK